MYQKHIKSGIKEVDNANQKKFIKTVLQYHTFPSKIATHLKIM